MTINVTMTLRQALRQLEAERGHIDRQIAALRGVLDGLGAHRKAVAVGASGAETAADERGSATRGRSAHEGLLGETEGG